MHPKSFKIKLLAVFVVAFVCMNAGGFVCVAYCQSSMKSVAAAEDHCPLQKKGSHCDPDKKADLPDASDSVASNKIECCRMAFSFVTAPLEKRTFSTEIAQVPATVRIEFAAPVLLAGPRQNPPPAYRGPPLDRRGERLKNCIIRI